MTDENNTDNMWGKLGAAKLEDFATEIDVVSEEPFKTTILTVRSITPSSSANRIPKASEVKAYLDQYVVGQHEAKKSLIVSIINHLYKVKHNEKQQDRNTRLKKNNIMLIGDSGVGKTYMVQLLARYFNIPLVIEDATKFSATGYVGGDVEDMLTALYVNAGRDISRAQKGIIFIDEVDKLCQFGSSREHMADVNTRQVQYGLLKMLEGNNIRTKIGFDRHAGEMTINTDDILFIFAGSFGGLQGDKKAIAEGKKAKTGFISQSFNEESKQIQEEDILKCGIIPEILGRIGAFIQLDNLTKDDYMHILTKTKNNPIEQFKTLFRLQNKTFPLQEKDFSDIVEVIVKSKLGARALTREVEKRLIDHLYD